VLKKKSEQGAPDAETVDRILGIYIPFTCTLHTMYWVLCMNEYVFASAAVFNIFNYLKSIRKFTRVRLKDGGIIYNGRDLKKKSFIYLGYLSIHLFFAILDVLLV
jgi:hypothetical protein